MIVTISFYIFSTILAFLDCKRYIVPNNILVTLLLFILIFGYFEEHLNIISFIISLSVLLFFVIILLINRKIILGGGDIKYMMVVALYINPLVFPLFILLTGIVQTLFLLFYQKLKGRRVAPMVPAMLIATALSELLYIWGVYP